MNYTDIELIFIEENYPKYGPKFCAEKLNKNEDALYAQAKRMGISKIDKKSKHPSMQNVNPEQFWTITQPEIAYFLGYFWADGYIHYKKFKTSNSYKIALEIVSEDANDINQIFSSTGKWNKQIRKRKENWKETTTINTNSKDIYNFLYETGYDEKSIIEPTKILSKIPEHLKHYWWRGFFDGDGGISYSKQGEGRWKNINFAGTINYKWVELIKLFEELSVKIYRIDNCTDKKGHTCSKVIVQNFENMLKLTNYLLKSEIGLTRKTEKLKNFELRFS